MSYDWAENHIKLDAVLKRLSQRATEQKLVGYQPTEEEVQTEYIRFGGRIVAHDGEIFDNKNLPKGLVHLTAPKKDTDNAAIIAKRVK